MIRIILFLTVILGLNLPSTRAQTPPAFEVVYSKPLSVLRFLEAAARVSHYSSTYHDIINTEWGDDVAFQALIRQFARIRTTYNFEWSDYPSSRRSQRNVADLINSAAVAAVDLKDFSRRIVGFLPHEDGKILINCLVQAEPYYEALLQPFQTAIEQQVQAYAPYLPQLDTIFQQISAFYGTSWPDNLPFVVCLYPIPAQSGTTSATPHGNSLVCAFLADVPDDYLDRLSVVTHEMCHTLYDAQPVGLQSQIEKWFLEHPSPYHRMAYNYIDEGLATALGNGWAYQVINNKMDTETWYNDAYIDAYGHALFPLVQEYIAQRKTIDSAFVDRAVQLFEKTLPLSIYDYKALMNNVHIYGTMTDTQIADVSKSLQYHFRMSSYLLSTPIMATQMRETLATTAGTKLFLINTDVDKNWQFLMRQSDILRQKIGRFRPDFGQYYAFLDEKNDATIILIFDGLDMLQELLKTMVYQNKIDNQRIRQN